MGVVTNPRAGRAARVLAIAQSAYGTPATNFSTALAARSPRLPMDLGRTYNEPVHMSAGGGPAAAGVHDIPRPKIGELWLRATPATVGLAWAACWGPLTAGAFAHSSQVVTRYSLLFVEDRIAAAGQKVARLADAWFPQVALDVDANARVTLRAQYAAEASEVRADNALAGWTLPARPMEPGDEDELPGRAVTLYRDPEGDNELVPFNRLSLIVVEERAVGPWDMGAGIARVHKAGHARVELALAGRVGDEAWNILTDARAGTPARYRFTAPGATAEFGAELHNVSWNVEPLEVAGLEYQPFIATGRAALDADGNFADFTLA